MIGCLYDSPAHIRKAQTTGTRKHFVADHAPRHIFSPKGGFRSTNKNLIDHGGPVLPTSHVYAIYWGPVPPDISDSLNSFFAGFGGSSYANILHPYIRRGPSSPPASIYAPPPPPPSPPPTHPPSVITIFSQH